jgi:hypothetical protein
MTIKMAMNVPPVNLAFTDVNEAYMLNIEVESWANIAGLVWITSSLVNKLAAPRK